MVLMTTGKHQTPDLKRISISVFKFGDKVSFSIIAENLHFYRL